MEFRVQGAADLGRISQQLKDAGRKDLQRSLRKRLREGVKPVLNDVKQASPSSTVDRALVSRFSFTANGAAVRIVAAKNRLPADKRQLAQLLEFGSQGSGGRYIRHPVYGSTRVFVNQPIQPYFYNTIRDALPEVERVVRRVLDDVAREAGFK